MEIKKFCRKAKALRMHPSIRYGEEVILSTSKEIKDSSKKIYRGPSPFSRVKSSKAEGIRSAVFRGKYGSLFGKKK